MSRRVSLIVFAGRSTNAASSARTESRRADLRSRCQFSQNGGAPGGFAFTLRVLIKTCDDKARAVERSGDYFQEILVLSNPMQKDDSRKPLTLACYRTGDQTRNLLASESVVSKTRDCVAFVRCGEIYLVRFF